MITAAIIATARPIARKSCRSIASASFSQKNVVVG
jgi:hypothetical protein